MAVRVATVNFSADRVNSIVASLPNAVSKKRRTLLPKVLREWGCNELHEHLTMEPRPVIRARVRRQELVGKCTRKLMDALSSLDEMDRAAIVCQMKSATRDRAQFAVLSNWIDEAPRFFCKLAAISPRQFWNLGRGNPRNLTPYLVLQDAAAIFEWYTGKKATRNVDRVTGKEIGPFFNFVSALWPIIFKNKTVGLSAAMKNWERGRLQYGERSPVIANISFRHRTWGVFEN